ncbi:hypothetical protein AURDEDRAFT_165287 [Auricularia subglabra TFB-10046 SS5]|nr:hypothetical protein AURDEDRAFT_165287 [Auricularia subglabra TFB-10046 SS5]
MRRTLHFHLRAVTPIYPPFPTRFNVTKALTHPDEPLASSTSSAASRHKDRVFPHPSPMRPDHGPASQLCLAHRAPSPASPEQSTQQPDRQTLKPGADEHDFKEPSLQLTPVEFQRILPLAMHPASPRSVQGLDSRAARLAPAPAATLKKPASPAQDVRPPKKHHRPDGAAPPAATPTLSATPPAATATRSTLAPAPAATLKRPASPAQDGRPPKKHQRLHGAGPPAATPSAGSHAHRAARPKVTKQTHLRGFKVSKLIIDLTNDRDTPHYFLEEHPMFPVVSSSSNRRPLLRLTVLWRRGPANRTVPSLP